jgi:hypothetical protein
MDISMRKEPKLQLSVVVIATAFLLRFLNQTSSSRLNP